MRGRASSSATPALRIAVGGSIAIACAVSLWLLARPTPFALGGDNLTLTHPLLSEVARRLQSGQLRIWSWDRWGGSPLIGDPVVGALYPPHLVGFLVTPFPHRRALDVDVALHLVWLAAGAAWWLRALGVSAAPAVAGVALLLSCPTFVAVAASWIQYWAALSWWPWLFGAALTFTRAPSLPVAVLAAVALAAQVYAGYPEFGLYSGAAALAWVAFRVGRRGGGALGRATGVAAAIAIGGAAIGLAAPQILPALAMARDSIRSGPESGPMLAAMSGLSMRFENWADALAPLPMNDLAPFRIAPAVAVLAVLGAARGGAPARWLAAVAIAAAALASGVLRATLGSIPVLSSFPAPMKLFYPFAFAVSSLAAIGLDRALRLPAAGQRIAIGIVGVSIVPAAHAVASSFASSLGWIAPAAAVASAAAPARRLSAVLIGVTLAAAIATFAATDPVHVAHVFGPARYQRLLERPLPNSFAGRPFARSLALADTQEVRQIGMNFGSLFAQPSWNGVGPLAQARQAAVLEGGIAIGDAAAVALAIGASPVVVWTGGPLDATLQAAGFVGPPPPAFGMRALFAPEVRPRFALAPDVRFASRREAIAAARAGTALGPGPVLVERPRNEAGDTSETGDVPVSGDPAGKVEVVEARWDRSRLAVTVDRPTWLLARDPYYAGWQVAIDGAPATVYPAGGFLFAFEVPQGSHEIVVAYRELGLQHGLAIAGGTLAAIAAGIFLTRRSRYARGRK
ncbi:MAG TPA: hypothetical protein VFD92_20540 [Candidatus Binatia bacterium]|nr:hypothetical protein [Candidatus Binatia bacterium]